MTDYAASEMYWARQSLAVEYAVVPEVPKFTEDADIYRDVTAEPSSSVCEYGNTILFYFLDTLRVFRFSHMCAYSGKKDI